MTKFKIISPVDGRIYAQRPYATDAEVEQALSAAENAAILWRSLSISERGALLRGFIEAFNGHRQVLAEQVSWQMGRPLAQADEMDAWTVGGKDLISIGEAALAWRDLDGGDGARRHVSREPYGVMLSICPWNYPVSICVALIIPPLMAGNVVLFKHAPQTALVIDALNAAARAAGLPAGVFTALDMTHEQSSRLIASERIDIVGFIGSERGGRQVHAAAGHAFKPFILELGGKDPVYVRQNVDIERAANEIALGAFGNSGQSCCSVERIYVDDAIHDRFVEAFVAAAAATRVGHPLEDNPDIGPVVSTVAAEAIRGQVQLALSSGATLLHDGDRSAGSFATSAYVGPIVLGNVDHSMSIMRDETFGPVAPIMRVSSDDEAIRLMNDSRYGLTAAIWSNDIDHALKLGQRLEAGSVVVNQCNYPDQLLPWGGIKASGLGRSDGLFAYDGVTQYKSYYARPLEEA